MIDTFTIGGVTIGSIASGYLIKRTAGFAYPQVNIAVQNRGIYHGAELGNYSYGARAMSIEGMIYGLTEADYEAKRQALAAALALHNGLQTATIVTKEGLSVTADVIVSASLDEPYEAGQAIYSAFRLEIVAPYPFLLGAESSQSVYPSEGGGFALPFAIPLDMSEGGAPNLITVTNSGNGIAYPVIKLIGSLENPSVYNETTGESFSVNHTLSGTNDFITIGTFYRTVVHGVQTNVRDELTGDFIGLIPGANVLKLSAASYSGQGRALVTYKSAYLGI